MSADTAKRVSFQPAPAATSSAAAADLKDDATEFTEEEIQEMKNVFSLFDHQGTGHVATEDLGTVIRGLGYNLTEKQLSDYINLTDHDGSGKFDFSMFFTIMNNHRPMRGPCTEPEVLDHFQPFDLYRDGHVTAEDLFNLLTKMGEPLPEEDVNNLLQEIEIDGDGRVDIRQFVHHMFESSAPEYFDEISNTRPPTDAAAAAAGAGAAGDGASNSNPNSARGAGGGSQQSSARGTTAQAAAGVVNSSDVTDEEASELAAAIEEGRALAGDDE